MVKAFAALILGLCFALSASAATAEKKQPDWAQLTIEQQQILAPLASEWNTLDERRRKKWLLLAKRYPKMKPDAQQRLQTQMKDWAKLTPAQRTLARENYKKLAKQPPEKREAVKKNWNERQKQRQAPTTGAAPPPTAPTGALTPPPASTGTLAPQAAPGTDTAAPPPAPAGPTR